MVENVVADWIIPIKDIIGLGAIWIDVVSDVEQVSSVDVDCFIDFLSEEQIIKNRVGSFIAVILLLAVIDINVLVTKKRIEEANEKNFKVALNKQGKVYEDGVEKAVVELQQITVVQTFIVCDVHCAKTKTKSLSYVQKAVLNKMDGERLVFRINDIQSNHFAIQKEGKVGSKIN